MSALLTVLAQSTDFLPDRGPDSSGDFRVDPNVFLLMFGIGFGLGVLGHLYKSKTMVGAGIALIMLSTILVPIFLAATR